MDINQLLMIQKEKIPQTAAKLDNGNIKDLVDLLTQKDDKIRYQAFLLLQSRSQEFDDVYPYFDVFSRKLKSDNSYQRSLGLMMIAENVRWDKQNRFDDMIDDYLNLFNDEKPITVRQCIQGLNKIVPYKKHLNQKIADSLMDIRLDGIKETMRKVILVDILNVLLLIRKEQKSDKIEEYISKAFSGGILDKKSKKQIEELL